MKKKKQSLDSGEFNLDDLEGLGDFNFGEVDSQTNPETRKKDRSPVANAFKGTISGAKSTLMDTGFIQKTAREVFPKQYGEVADQVGETFNSVSALYNDAVREVKPAAGRVAKQLDKLVPAEYARTKKLTSKLAKMMGVEDDAPVNRGPSREEAASDEIGRIFSAQEEGRAQERAEDRAEGLAKDEISRQRFESNSSNLSSINANVGRLAAYNDKINLAYQKKSLELQYRSIFAQADLLDTTKRFFEIFKSQNDAISKNTSLPDYVKLKTSERAADFARNKFMGAIGSSLFGNGEFLKRGLANVKKVAGEKIKSVGAAFGQASMGLDELQMAKDQADSFANSGMDMPGISEIGGNFAGSVGMEALAGKLGGMARKKFIKPGGAVEKLGYRLASGSMDAASIARQAYNSETLQNADWEGGIKGYVKRAAKSGLGLLLGASPDMSIDTGKGIGDAREHAQFDNRTQTSIVTIIPGYLGRILREVKILRTGNASEGMTVYDYGKGDFTSMDASRAGVKERAVEAYNSKGFSYGAKWGADKIKGSEKLSPEAEKALRDRMRKHARSNDGFKPADFFDNSLYEGLDPATADELKNFAETRFGDQAEEKDKNRYTLATELRELRSRIPDIRAEVQMMVNAGYTEQLESLGIISKTSRGYSINFEKYSEIVAKNAEGEDKEEPVEEKMVSNGYNFGTRAGAKRSRPFGKKGNKIAPVQPFTIIRNQHTHLPPEPKLAREEPRTNAPDAHSDAINNRVNNVIPIVQGIKTDTAAILEKLGGIQTNTMNIKNFDMKEVLDSLGAKISDLGTSAKEMAIHAQEQGKETFNKLKTAAGQYAPQAKTYLGAAKDIASMSLGLAMAVTRDTFTRLGSAAVKFNDSVLKPTGRRMAEFYNKYKEPVLQFSKDALASGFELTAKAFGRARDIATDLVTKKLPVGFAMLRKLTTDTKNKILNALDKPIDIYVMGSDSKDPILLASIMRAGGYFDKNTGEPIQRPSQIKGPIVNAQGEVILTENDVKMGLIDQYGEKLKTPWQKLIGGVVAIGKNAIGNLLDKIPLLGNLGKRFADTLNGMFGGLVQGLTGGAKKRLAVLIQIRDLLNTRLPGKRSKFEDMDQMFRNGNAGGGLRSADLGVIGANVAGAATTVKEKAKGLFERTRDKFKSPETQERIKSGKDKAKDFVKKAGMAIGGSLVPMGGNSVMDKLQQLFSGKPKFNENEKGERKGSWKQIAEDREKKNAYRNAHRDRNKASLDPKYKSSENVIDMMIRMAKEFAEKRKEGLLEGAEDVADLAGDLPEGQGKSRRELAKERLKRMKAAKAAKTGGRLGRVGRAMGAMGRGAGNVLRAGGALGNGVLKTGQAIGKVGGGAINAARTVGAPIAGALGRAGGLVAKVPGIARVGGIARTAATVGRIGLTAASLMMPGTGGLIAGGLSLAGSALGGLATVLASPVVLGAAAIGLAAYGGYKAYQYFTRNKADDFSKIRLLQYGFGEKEKDQFYRALQLEEYLTKEAVGYENGKAYIIEKKIDSEKLLNFFSVDKENEDHTNRFVSWFNNRFKPFFLTSLTALYAVDNKGKFDTIEKLDPDKQLQYLKAAAYENGPYDATSSPFEKNEPLSGTKKQVMDAIDVVRTKLEKEKKTKSKDKKEPFALSGKGAIAGALAGAVVAGPLGAIAGGVIGAVAPNFKTQAINALKMTGSILAAPVKFIYDKTISVTRMLGYNLTALMSVRYKCYGLVEMDHVRSSVLNNLERHVAELVTYEKDNSSHYKEDMGALLKDVGPTFGVNDINDKRAPEWISWFNNRFLPVFLRYMAMGHQRTNKKGVEEIEQALTSSQKYEIGVAVAGTNGIWNVKDSPFRDYAVGRDKSVVDPNLNFLKDKVKEEKVQEEAKLAAAKKAAPAPIKKPEPKPPVIKPPKDTSSYHEVEPKVEGVDPKADGDAQVGPNGQKIPGADGPKADPSQGDQFIKTNKNATLGGVQNDMLANFRAMSAEYGQKTGKVVGVNSGYRSYDQQMELYRQDPSKAAKPGRSLHEFGLAIDANSVNLDEMDKLGLMRKYGFTRPVGGEPWHLEPAGIQVNIAKAKEDPQFAAEAVKGSEGVGGGGVGSVPGTPKGKRNTQLAINNMGLDATVAPKSDTDTKDNVSTALATRAKSGQFSDKSKEQQPPPQREVPKSSTNGSFDINTAGKTYASSAGGGSVGVLKEANSKSGTFEQAQDTEQGSLGKAKLSGDTSSVAATIDSAARATGMDPNVLKTFAAVESRMDPNARADGSSAAGLFQFTRGTWNEVTSKYGGKYGISSSTPPTDPKAASLMAGEYLKQNARVVDDVKPQLNATDLYLTHFLGPGGAKRFLSNSPGDIGASALPKAAAANRSIFYEDGRALSLGQIYTGLSGRLKKRAKEFGIDGSPTAPALKNTGGTGGPDTITNDAHVAGVATMQSGKKSTAYKGQTNSGVFKAPTVSPGAGTDTGLSNSAPAGAVASASTSSYVEQPQKPGLASAEESLSGVADTLEESLGVQKQMLMALTQLVGSLSPEQLKQISPKMKEVIDNGVKADDPSETRPTPANNPASRRYDASNGKAVTLPDDGINLDRVLVA